MFINNKTFNVLPNFMFLNFQKLQNLYKLVNTKTHLIIVLHEMKNLLENYDINQLNESIIVCKSTKVERQILIMKLKHKIKLLLYLINLFIYYCYLKYASGNELIKNIEFQADDLFLNDLTDKCYNELYKYMEIHNIDGKNNIRLILDDVTFNKSCKIFSLTKNTFMKFDRCNQFINDLSYITKV
jgi:hypothetical protein